MRLADPCNLHVKNEHPHPTLQPGGYRPPDECSSRGWEHPLPPARDPLRTARGPIARLLVVHQACAERGPTSDASVVAAPPDAGSRPRQEKLSNQGSFPSVSAKNRSFQNPRRLHPKRRPPQPQGECRLNSSGSTVDRHFMTTPLSRDTHYALPVPPAATGSPVRTGRRSSTFATKRKYGHTKATLIALPESAPSCTSAPQAVRLNGRKQPMTASRLSWVGQCRWSQLPRCGGTSQLLPSTHCVLPVAFPLNLRV